jgi:hypothetical protein
VFENSLTRQQLSTLSRQSVKEFVVKTLIDDEAGVIIDFPELKSLSITQGSFCTIENIFAPEITDLRIVASKIISPIRKKPIFDTIPILRERPDNIMLKPTKLTLDIPLSTTEVLAILQHWPQLQYFTLTFGDEIAWNKAFPNAFTREESPLCPELRTLRLIGWYITNFPTKEEQWKRIVMSIYKARRNTPLQTIEWLGIGQDWKWHSASTEAQD